MFHSVLYCVFSLIWAWLSLLYSSGCWAIWKDQWINALEKWCLHMLLGIKWHQFVWNDDVWRLTKQPKLTAIIKLRRLTLFGHIVRMDDYAGAKRILLASSPPADWRRQLGCPCVTWLSTVQHIWDTTTLHSPKQWIWLRTTLCGGCCRCLALRNLKVACQKWWRCHYWCSWLSGKTLLWQWPIMCWVWH